jgi:hypothetical protein
MNDGQRPITPIFIFSLPRSGSTLTQRLLATHPDVDTSAETWLLIPLLYAARREGAYSEYSHHTAFKAIEDFCSTLPGGLDDFRREIRKLALRLYARKSRSNARYFLDKTPRYHVLSPDIMRMFPESPIVFLWRNPLAIIASMIETWGGGKWNIYEFTYDLYDGLEGLIAGIERADGRVVSVRYEDLVGVSSVTRERLFNHIGLSFDDSQTGTFANVQLTGRMGDQTGSGKYLALSAEPGEKWRRVLASPARKSWCRRYLRWIGKDRLKLMGYELDVLLHDLDRVPASLRTVPSDLARMLFGLVVRACEPWLIRDKLAWIRRGRRLRVHR